MELNNKLDNLTDEQIEKIIKKLQKEIAELKQEINNKQVYLQELINSIENK